MVALRDRHERRDHDDEADRHDCPDRAELLGLDLRSPGDADERDESDEHARDLGDGQKQAQVVGHPPWQGPTASRSSGGHGTNGLASIG